jgi:hypothetical protein
MKFREYFENTYSNKLKDLEEMDKLLDAYDLPKLNQEHINHLNRSVMGNEIEALMKNIPRKKSPVLDGFIDEFCQTFKENYHQFSSNFYRK